MKILTIGIPAYNEEKNIVMLIKLLSDQILFNVNIEKIIIVSDCSSDKTDELVKRIKNKKIKLIRNSTRTGKAYSQDVIISNTTSDVLVIIDADTVIKDSYFLQKLINPILEKKVDLTAAMIDELPPNSFIGKILDASMKFKKKIYYSINKGKNVYTCCGRARAFSKRLYTSLSFKGITVGEDAYSYYYCLYKNMLYEPCPKAKIFYTLPSTLQDHKKQTIRYFISEKELTERIDQNVYRELYHLPKRLLLQFFLLFLVRKPIILFYFPILIYYKLSSTHKTAETALWDVATTSKNI